MSEYPEAERSAKAEPISIIIRSAVRGDAPVILQLITALADFEKLPPPDEEAQHRLIADAFGSQPRFEIFLADTGSKIVGYAFVYETYSTFLARPTLFLEDLFVLPEYRKGRIGYALFQHCAREAVRRECGRMEWMVLDWNTPAIKFYEQLGATRMNMWLPFRLTQAELQRLVE